jgi:hypothetical protein
MHFVTFSGPLFAGAAMLALLSGGAASAAGFGVGGSFHGGGAMHGAGGFHGAPSGGMHGAAGAGHGASALPPRGQWIGNDGFGGPGNHWSPGRRQGGVAHSVRNRPAGWLPNGQRAHHRFGRHPGLAGYGVGYLGGGGYGVGYYGGNGVYYAEEFYGYTDDMYRPAAYTAASGYAPIYGDPVFFDLTYGQSVIPPVYRPAVVLEPAKPLPHIIHLPTTTENPHIIR